MREEIKKQIKIWTFMLLIGFAIIGVLSFFNGEEQNTVIIDNSIPENVRNINSPQITWNNVALFDSTQYDDATNTCNAYRYGMNVTISPCVAYDVDGKDIEQDVSFKWQGLNQRNISWIFVYDYALDGGSISVLKNNTYDEQYYEVENRWINNYLVDKVVSYNNLTTPPQYCDLGNLNNTQFYNVVRNTGNATTYNQTICFTSRTVVNATAFRISGNADIPIEHTRQYSVFEYVDVTNQIQYLGKGLLNDNRSYYKVEDVTFNPNQEINTRWQYTPKDATKRGKWHILGYDSNTGLVQSVINDEYIYIDPWWSGGSAWGKKKEIIITETSGSNLLNYTVNFYVPYDSDMQSDFDDLRFLESTETTELPYWIEKYNTTTATVYLRYADRNLTASSNTSIYMYYGNSGASTTSNKNTTFLFNDDFGGGTLDSTKWNSAVGTNPASTIVVNNGRLNFMRPSGGSAPANQINGVIVAKNTIPYPYKITYQFNVVSCTPSNTLSAGSGDTSTASDYTYASFDSHNDVSEVGCWGGLSPATNFIRVTGTTASGVGLSLPTATLWNYTYNKISSTNRSYYINNSYQNSLTKSFTAQYPVIFSLGGGATSPSNFSISDYRIQTYSWKEPTVTFGTEQSSEGISVALNSPANAYKTNNTNVTFNYTINPSSINVTNWTLYVWYANNTIAHQHFSGTLNTNSSVNVAHADTLFIDNNYIWNVYGCGYSSASATHYCSFASNQTFQVHTDAPQFTLNSLPNVTTITLPTNNTFNITSSDTNLNACQYWTSESATRVTYTCNTTQTVNFTTGGTKTLYVWANDTFGNSNDTSYTFRIYDFNVTQSENADPIAEGSNSYLYLLINSTSFAIGDAEAVITFNSTQYPASSKNVLDTNSILFTYTYPVTAGLGNSSGKTYSYNWTYNTTQLTTRTTPTTTQTIISFAIDSCSVYTVEIANFSLKDEEQNTQLYTVNSTATLLEIDAIVTSISNPDISWSYSQSFINATSIRLCVPTGVLNSANYTMDITIGFDGTNHVREFWYLDNGTLSATTNFNSLTPKNTSLMDLLTADSTTFLFEFTGEDGLEVDNSIVHVFRKYIGEGIFREVERARQDDNGQTHVHLVEEDVIYYFVISQYGNIIYTSNTYNAKCLASPCEISLSASPDTTNWDIIDSDGGQYSVTANKDTRVVTTTFSLSTIDLVNVSLYELDDGNMKLVNQSSLTATAGSIALNVPLAYGNKTFFVAIHNNNNFVKSEWVDLTDRGRDYFGTTGAILGGLIVLAIMLMAVSEGVGFIIFTCFALLVVGIMKLVDLGWLSLVSIICAGFIIIFKLVKRRQQA